MLVRVRARPVVDVSTQHIHLDFVVYTETSRLPRGRLSTILNVGGAYETSFGFGTCVCIA